MRGEYFDRTRPVEQLHFGGGTPTFLPPHRLSGFIEALARHFQLTDAPGRDYSIEIDPRTVDTAFLRAHRGARFQPDQPGSPRLRPRRAAGDQPRAAPRLVERLLGDARRLGFGSINFDLIYGLPRQSLDHFAATLDRVSRCGPIAWPSTAMRTCRRCSRHSVRSSPRNCRTPPTRLALLQLAVTG